jgi:N-acetylglucosamine-6-phosphate deacetylase
MNSSWVDIHIHGQNGLDVMSSDPEEVQELTIQLLKQGIVAFVPTLMTAPPSRMLQSLEVIKKIKGRELGAKILGVHLEGPFLNPKFRGVHPLKNISVMDPKQLKEWVKIGEGLIKIITLAPEIPGVLHQVAWLKDQGIVVSMGHSQATYQEAKQGKLQGAKSVTHLFNAMRPFHHREPGLIGLALEDQELYTELIADGVHLADKTVQFVLQWRPSSKIILVSDNCPLSLKPQGSYQWNHCSIQVHSDSSLRTRQGVLAASYLSLSQIIRRLLHLKIISSIQARQFAFHNPLCLLGIDEKIFFKKGKGKSVTASGMN